MPPSYVHRITKYDPADRDEHGHYTGAEDTVSDHGPVEAAYLAAFAAFAEASGIDRLEAGHAFTVHVGWDQYMYVGSDRPCAEAVVRLLQTGVSVGPAGTRECRASRRASAVTSASTCACVLSLYSRTS